MGDGVKRVSVASRPEAGVPDTVLSTWHVIGAAIVATGRSEVDGQIYEVDL